MKQFTTDELGRPDLNEYIQLDKLPVVVILDNIRSGLNVGAIFRTADAFSIDTIYLCGITARPPHQEILKTALGATDSVNWVYAESCADIVRQLQEQNFLCLPVEQTDASILLSDWTFQQNVKLALVFGNEMRGVQPEVLSLCTNSLEIPQDGIKHSLNVATAAGIVLWEVYRQYHLLLRLSG